MEASGELHDKVVLLLSLFFTLCYLLYKRNDLECSGELNHNLALHEIPYQIFYSL